MGNQPMRPKPPHAAALRARVDESCETAAEAILDADVLLLATGAGWSADSGLAIYRDIAKIEAYAERDLDYRDMCKPSWLAEAPELFWGFWGSCFNDYRSTAPHGGYGIVRGWRDGLFSRSEVAKTIRDRVRREELIPSLEDLKIEEEANAPSPPPGAFFVYTSNVDAHSYDAFDAGEIRECHGNVELYQCGAAPRPCARRAWRAPRDHAFAVDAATMLAPRDAAGAGAPAAEEKAAVDDVPKVGATAGAARDAASLLRCMPAESCDREASFATNWPTCPACGGPARPAVLMFEDCAWVDSAAQDRRYREWVLAVRSAATELDRPLRVAILEVGAGGNVTTVRCESEHVFRGADNVETTLIRVNPELPLPDGDPEKLRAGDVAVVSVMCRGLEAVAKIDAALKDRRPDLFDRGAFEELP